MPVALNPSFERLSIRSSLKKQFVSNILPAKSLPPRRRGRESSPKRKVAFLLDKSKGRQYKTKTMSHRPYKKTKNTKDLLEEKDQLESLKSALIPIYLSCSEEDLMCVIKTKLPDLCQVDSIELSRQKIKKSNSVYSYSFIYKDTAYFIHFHKEKSIERKNILKKIGKALESTLIYLEQSERLKNK